jgi:hypothetical protein
MALPSYIIEVQYDIKDFNDHVTSQMAQLDAQGEQSMPNMNFTKYIETGKDDHDEGTFVYTPKKLMRLAFGKAKLMNHNGEWLKATPGGEKIIALMSKLKTLEKSSSQLQNRLKQGVAPANKAKPKGVAKPCGKPKAGTKPADELDHNFLTGR